MKLPINVKVLGASAEGLTFATFCCLNLIQNLCNRAVSLRHIVIFGIESSVEQVFGTPCNR